MFTTPTELLPGTAIAASTYPTDNGTARVRIYSQDVDGGIRESWLVEKTWYGGSSTNVISTNAKIHTPIAAVSLVNYKRRIYFLSPDNVIREWAQDSESGKWYETDLYKKNVKASPASRLAAIAPEAAGLGIWLCYQNPNGDFGWLWYDNGQWSGNIKGCGSGILGSGLAAVTFKRLDGKPVIRIYYQHPSGGIAESGWDGADPWNIMNLFPIPNNPGVTTHIAACTTPQKGPQIPGTYVWFLQNDNALSQTYNDGTGTWTKVVHPAGDRAAPASGAAIVSLPATSELRAYVQGEDNRIQEYTSKDGSIWAKGSIVPTGPNMPGTN